MYYLVAAAQCAAQVTMVTSVICGVATTAFQPRGVPTCLSARLTMVSIHYTLYIFIFAHVAKSYNSYY